MREAVGLAVQEAVQAVLVEVLTNPLLREQLQRPAAPEAAPPDDTSPQGGGGQGRLAVVCARVCATLRSAGRAAAGWLQWAGQAVSLAWRLAGDRVRAVLLVAVAYLAHTTLPATARRLGGAARDLASRAWAALRRALPGLDVCGT